jgi:hypothetical protein
VKGVGLTCKRQNSSRTHLARPRQFYGQEAVASDIEIGIGLPAKSLYDNCLAREPSLVRIADA